MTATVRRRASRGSSDSQVCQLVRNRTLHSALPDGVPSARSGGCVGPQDDGPSACGPPGVSIFPHRRVDSGPKRSSILHRFGMDTPETSLSVGARAVLAQGVGCAAPVGRQRRGFRAFSGPPAEFTYCDLSDAERVMESGEKPFTVGKFESNPSVMWYAEADRLATGAPIRRLPLLARQSTSRRATCPRCAISLQRSPTKW